MSELDIIRAGIPVKDGCPVLTRVKAFIVPQATTPTLEYVFRDRASGNPLDLTVPLPVSESASTSESEPASDEILLRCREIVGSGDLKATTVHRSIGTVVDAKNGVVRVPLTEVMTRYAGIFKLSFGLVREGTMLVINEGTMSVEHNLFYDGRFQGTDQEGPPTINTLRMHMMDNAAAENPLLDDVEFDDDQIVQALVLPVEEFNETPPPLNYDFNTLNFPYRQALLNAALGRLYGFAAAHYRRNRMQIVSGGVNIDDLNRENEYLRAAAQLLEEWKLFRTMKKVQLNMEQGVGTLGSTYGRIRGR